MPHSRVWSVLIARRAQKPVQLHLEVASAVVPAGRNQRECTGRFV